MQPNKHIGSSLDDFLKADALLIDAAADLLAVAELTVKDIRESQYWEDGRNAFFAELVRSLEEVITQARKGKA